MATERLYGLTGKIPAKPMTGQAAIIFGVMGGNTGTAPEFKTGKAWTELVVAAGKADPAKDLKTRQDPYRVVLYYLLVFKKRELVIAHEQNVDEPAAVSEEPVTDTIDASAYTQDQLDNPHYLLMWRDTPNRQAAE